MDKLQKRTNIILILVMMLALLMSTFVSKVYANNSYDYTYMGVEKYGESDGDTPTALMKVEDSSDKIFNVYCIDRNSFVKDNYKYSIVNVSDANYYSTENANKIRNIVLNAYPYIELQNLRIMSGIPNLTDEQAIAGAQAAIWNYSNDSRQTALTGNSKSLYDWYLRLPGKLIVKTTVANIDMTQEKTINQGKYEIKISYKANATNEDGSQINLTYSFDKDLAKQYGAIVEDLGKDANSYEVIKVSNLPEQANFNINVTGTQNLSKDAYFYMPQQGDIPVQSLVGVRNDSINISNAMAVNLEQVGGYNLTIKKVDSLSLAGIANAEFQIASDKNFTKNLLSIKTGTDGTAVVPNLTKGLWYVKETKAPSGYIPDTEIKQVYINEQDIQVQYKNAKYGEVDVYKIDENNNPVKGAKFNIYKGKTITDENLVKKDLESNENGNVIISDLLPGDYTLIETYAPDGYIMNADFIYFTVQNYKTTKITHVNETVGYCSMNLYKKDAVTNEQLDGGRFAIYTDENYQNKIAEVVSSKDNAVSVNSLRPGTYYVKEIEPPEGYLLDSAPKKVTLIKNQTAEIVFYNSQNYSTAGNYASILIAGIALLIIAGGIIAARKIQTKNRRKNV